MPVPAASRHRMQPRDSDRKSTRLNSIHVEISYAVFCLKKKIHIFRITVIKCVLDATAPCPALLCFAEAAGFGPRSLDVAVGRTVGDIVPRTVEPPAKPS